MNHLLRNHRVHFSRSDFLKVTQKKGFQLKPYSWFLKNTTKIRVFRSFNWLPVDLNPFVHEHGLYVFFQLDVASLPPSDEVFPRCWTRGMELQVRMMSC